MSFFKKTTPFLVALNITYAVNAFAQNNIQPTWIEQADINTPIINTTNEEIGRLYVKNATDGVMLFVDVANLPAGLHGMHFHNMGMCSDHATFKQAGPHIAPSGKPHGFFASEGPHEGNLPNLIVGLDGTAKIELYTNLLSLNGAKAPLQDADGSALIIHADQDDHTTQPIGNSGARIACGLIVGK